MKLDYEHANSSNVRPKKRKELRSPKHYQLLLEAIDSQNYSFDGLDSIAFTERIEKSTCRRVQQKKNLKS